MDRIETLNYAFVGTKEVSKIYLGNSLVYEAIPFPKDMLIFILGNDSWQKGILFSNNNGKSYEKLFPEKTAFGGLAMSPSGNAIITGSSQNTTTLLLSEDRGNTWQEKRMEEGFWTHCAGVSENAQHITVGNQLSVYYSNDKGNTWKESNTPSCRPKSLKMSKDGKYQIIGSNYTSYSSNVLVSSDYGAAFKSAYYDAGDGSSIAWVKQVAISQDGSRMYAEIYNQSDRARSYIIESTDYGNRWTRKSFSDYDWGNFDIDATGNQIIVTASKGILLNLDANNNTWHVRLADKTVEQVFMSSDGNTMACLVQGAPGYNLMMSFDRGDTWYTVSKKIEYFNGMEISKDLIF